MPSETRRHGLAARWYARHGGTGWLSGGLLCPSDRCGVDRRHRREVDGLIRLGLHGPSLVALSLKRLPRVSVSCA